MNNRPGEAVGSKDTMALHYTTAIVKQGVRQVWRQQVGLLWPAATIAVGTAAFYLALHRHRADWVVGAMATSALISAMVIAAAYWAQRRHSLRALSLLNGEPACMTLDVEYLMLSSAAGEARIPWSQIKTVWRLSSVWALEYRSGGLSMLPKSDLDEASRTFLLECCHRAGAKLR